MGLQSLHERGHGVARGWPRRPAARTTRAVDVAEHKVESAAARYRQLRAAAASGPPARKALRSWQQMILLIVGGGLVLGVLFLWLLTTMYLGYVALLALPLLGGLAWMLVVRFRRSKPVRRPVVEDLVRAMQELREAEAAARRAQTGDGKPAPGPQRSAPPPS